DREDVWLVLLVRAERRDDDLHIVAEPFGEERSDRPVGQASGEDPLLGGAALAPRKGAWDLPCGVEALLEVDGEREEVDAGSHGDLLVSLRAPPVEVSEQPAALSDHREKPAPTRLVVAGRP